MREFTIGPGKYFQKIKGDTSVLPFDDQQKIREGKLPLDEPSEKEKVFEGWLNSGEGEAVLDQRHKKALFRANGVLAEFCREYDIKMSPPPVTYYIPEEQWPKVVEFYGEDVVGMKGGGVADEYNRILIHIRETRPDDQYYNAQRFIHFVANVCHENLHQLAYRVAGAEKRGGGGDVFLTRWGVEVRNPKKGKRYLVDLDEAIIYYFGNKMAEKVINGHKDLVGDFLGNENTRVVMRDPFVNVVAYLVERLAELRGGGSGATREVERIFINAEFKGNLLDLGKEISKLYGKGGLRVLAHLDCGKDENNRNTEDNNRELIMKFIKARTKETQTHYAFRILCAKDPEEFERYKRLMAENGSKK